MDYKTLNGEIVNDPLGRGYSGLSNLEIANSLNTKNRNINKTSITGDEIFAATDATEFNSLPDGSTNNSADKKTMWIAFCSRQNLNPFGSANVAFVQYIFGSGSTTISNLQTLRTETVSRAEELGIGNVTEGDIIRAKAYPVGGG